MLYNFLFIGDFPPSVLSPAVAREFDVPSREVDVAERGEWESRNWEAAISCEYSRVHGDVALEVGVYEVESARKDRSEASVASALARILKTPVLFPEGVRMPGVRRIATPRGEMGFARIKEPESEEEELKITEIEFPVPQVPGAEVSRFPDMIKEIRHPTPITDGGFSATAEGASRRMQNLLVDWERLTVRMVSGWPPSSWYPVSMYVEDLQHRDEAGALLSAGTYPSVSEALAEIDRVYRKLTIDDGGRALAEAAGLREEDLGRRPWYWRRRPEDVPWGGEDSAG